MSKQEEDFLAINNFGFNTASWNSKNMLSGIFGGGGDPAKANMQMFRMLDCNPNCDEHKGKQSPLVQEVMLVCKCQHQPNCHNYR
jgi:hypothetical protein